MLIQLFVTSAIGAVVVKEVVLRFERRRHSRRRDQRLVQAIQKAASDPLVWRKPQLSERRSEMELLLLQLECAGETLSKALAAEAELAEQQVTSSLEPPSCLTQWHEARRTVQEAQELYSQKADSYFGFVHSLAPPLRASATERGNRAMAFGDACFPLALG